MNFENFDFTFDCKISHSPKLENCFHLYDVFNKIFSVSCKNLYSLNEIAKISTLNTYQIPTQVPPKFWITPLENEESLKAY